MINNATESGLQRKTDFISARKNAYFRRVRKIKRIITHLVLILVAMFAVFPIYYIIVNSLSPLATLASVSVTSMLPILSRISFGNYQALFAFQHGVLLRTWLTNTLIYAGTSSMLGIALSITSGIGLSRFRIPGRKAILYMLLILSTFPFVIMVIPFYDMFSTLHLTNSYIGLIIPYSASAVIFAAWMNKNYVDSIPRDFEEAAQIDGYSRTQALFRILVPMTKPVIILTLLLAFFGPYTDYALINVLVSKNSLWNMALGMYATTQISSHAINYGMFSAFAVIMGLPIFIIFIIFQKYLVSGFSITMYK